MAGIIVVDRIESDASYASSINIASPLVVSNTTSFANNVGIGTTTPGTILNAYNSTSAIIALDGDSATQFRATRYSSDTTPSQLLLRKSRGTLASPTAVNTSDISGGIFFSAYGGTNFRSIARIDGIVKTYTSNDNISGDLIFYTNAGSTDVSPVVRVTSDKYIRFDSGTGGIQFNGDTAAANALDDYEEGTWTPAITGTTTTPTFTGFSSTGKYIKIGRKVTATAYFAWTSKTSGSGSARLTGWPFTFDSNAVQYQAGTIAYVGNGGYTDTAVGSFSLHSWPNTTEAQILVKRTGIASTEYAAVSSFSNSACDFIVSFTYLTTA